MLDQINTKTIVETPMISLSTAAADAVCPPQSAWKSAWITRP